MSNLTAVVVLFPPPAPPLPPTRHSNVSAAVGSTIVLPCDISTSPTPNPEPMYKWVKLGVPTPSPFPASDVNENNGGLMIQQVTEEDAGNYQCTASNAHGMSVQVVTLTVTAATGKCTKTLWHNMFITKLSLYCHLYVTFFSPSLSYHRIHSEDWRTRL